MSAQGISIDMARAFIDARLSACIMYLETESAADFIRYALMLFEMIGYVRGRSKDQSNAECVLLHQIKEAVYSRDLSELWELQNKWAVMRHVR